MRYGICNVKRYNQTFVFYLVHDDLFVLRYNNHVNTRIILVLKY